MPIFHNLDGSFGNWLAVEAIATDDDAGHLVRCMRSDPVVGGLNTQFASLAEFIAFLKFLEADPGVCRGFRTMGALRAVAAEVIQPRLNPSPGKPVGASLRRVHPTSLTTQISSGEWPSRRSASAAALMGDGLCETIKTPPTYTLKRLPPQFEINTWMACGGLR
jgi:hypothetical protein